MWLDNLKELKEKSGMTSKQIADKSRLPERTVVRIFADASVSEEELEELSAAAMRGDPLIETEIIPANDSLCPLTLSFE